MTQISVKNLTVQYNDCVAVDNVSFEINKGDYICVLGDNGSGKTTLTKAILGLLNIKSGTIEYNFKKTDIGYLPQQTPIQKDFPASVFEVVISGLLNKKGLRPFYTKKEKQIANDYLEELNVLYLKNKSYKELSGGQQQRVLLARALCKNNEILMLDEPLSGLDVKTSREFYDLIDEINKNGTTIFMVSHDHSSCIKNGRKIIYMESEMKFFGSAGEFINTQYYKCH